MYLQKRKIIGGLPVLGISIIAIFWCLTEYSVKSQYFVAGLTLYISVLLVYEYRNNIAPAIMLVYMAYANYSVVVGVYWFPEIRPNVNMYSQISDNKIYGNGIIMMLIYVLLLYMMRGIMIERKERKIERKIDENIYVEIICTVAFVLIYFTQIDFSATGRAEGNALSEYRYVMMLFAWRYSKKDGNRKKIWTFLVGITSILTMVGGNRTELIPPLVLLVVLWYPEIKVKWLLPLVPPIIVIFTIIGGMRNEVVLSHQTIKNAIDSISKFRFTTDSFTYAYLPSLLTMMISQTDSFWTKINLLVENTLYVFLGGQYGKYCLANYSRQYYVHYFGFFAPLTFYYWTGIIGAVITAIITKMHMIEVEQRNKRETLSYLIACSFIATFSRWYTYNFILLLRLDFVIILGWVAFGILNDLTKQKVIKK